MRIPEIPPEFATWTMSDGYALRGRLWPPTRSADVGCLYVHGIQSHGGWFAWSASLISQSGCPVLLADRRGSGLNPRARGDTPSAERWLEDLDELATWLERAYGVRRLALTGVSWGAKPAVAWALRRRERVARLLLVAPGLFPAVGYGLGARVRVGVSALTDGTRTFRIPLDDVALFTANPEGRRFIAEDDLKLTRATARFFYHSRRLDKRLARARRRSLPRPVTLVLAERDRIVRNRPTCAWLRRLTGGACDGQLFEGAEHTIEFERDVTRFGQLLRDWSRTPHRNENPS